MRRLINCYRTTRPLCAALLMHGLLTFSLLGSLSLSSLSRAATDLSEHKDLLGVWASNCFWQAPEFGQAAGYRQDTYTFGASGSYTLETQVFNDAGCQGLATSAETYYGSYSLGGALVNRLGKRLTQLNLSIDHPDWPSQVGGGRAYWVYQIDHTLLRFGSDRGPDSQLNDAIWFTRVWSSGQGPLVF